MPRVRSRRCRALNRVLSAARRISGRAGGGRAMTCHRRPFLRMGRPAVPPRVRIAAWQRRDPRPLPFVEALARTGPPPSGRIEVRPRGTPAAGHCDRIPAQATPCPWPARSAAPLVAATHRCRISSRRAAEGRSDQTADQMDSICESCPPETFNNGRARRQRFAGACGRDQEGMGPVPVRQRRSGATPPSPAPDRHPPADAGRCPAVCIHHAPDVKVATTGA